MKPSDILERAEDWNQRGDYLRLRPAEWVLLAGIDGESTVGKLVQRAANDEAFVLSTLLKFIQLDLARRAELSWEEFCRRCPEPIAAQARVPQVAAAPAAVAQLPQAAVVMAEPEPAAPALADVAASTPPVGAPAQVRFRLTGTARSKATAPPSAHPEIAIPTNPLPKPPPSSILASGSSGAHPETVIASASVPLRTQPVPLPDSLSLRSVLDFVMGHAGGGNRGQLAVYRTFLKVPASQLRESGIKSLDLATSEVQITDPALQASILNAVHAVVGRPYQGAT